MTFVVIVLIFFRYELIFSPPTFPLDLDECVSLSKKASYKASEECVSLSKDTS